VLARVRLPDHTLLDIGWRAGAVGRRLLRRAPGEERSRQRKGNPCRKASHPFPIGQNGFFR